jgi:serpin B
MTFPLIIVYLTILICLSGIFYYQIVRPAQNISPSLRDEVLTGGRPSEVADTLVKNLTYVISPPEKVTVHPKDATSSLLPDSGRKKPLEDKRPKTPDSAKKTASGGKPGVSRKKRVITPNLSLKARSNLLGSRLWDQFNHHRVYSPVSVAVSLSVLHQAAQGDTKDEISELLEGGFSYQELLSLAQQFSVGNSSSNSLMMTSYMSLNGFLHPVSSLNSTFVNLMKPICAISCDNFNDSMKTVAVINNYFSDRTDGILTNAAKSIKYDSNSLLFNTLYFKGRWKYPFDNRVTFHINFTSSSGTKRIYRAVKNVIKAPYYGNDELQLIELEFAASQFMMGFMLPKPAKGLKSAPVVFNESKLFDAISGLKTNDYVQVILPKFRFKRMWRMMPWLKNLGVKDTFDPKRADFSILSSNKDYRQKNLYFTDIVHEGFLSLDEIGSNSPKTWWTDYNSEKRNSSLPQPVKQFYANRNFLFYIRHKVTILLLFLGDLDG